MRGQNETDPTQMHRAGLQRFGNARSYFGGVIASFAAFATRNFSTFFAGI